MTAIRRLRALPPDFPALAAVAEAEGFRMLRVLATEWTDGANRFAGPGEALFGGVAAAGDLVAIGGITRDPWAEALRMRRFYVAPWARRGGTGTALARAVLSTARGCGAGLVRLRAPASAFAFWEALGFRPLCGDPQATHIIALD